MAWREGYTSFRRERAAGANVATPATPNRFLVLFGKASICIPGYYYTGSFVVAKARDARLRKPFLEITFTLPSAPSAFKPGAPQVVVDALLLRVGDRVTRDRSSGVYMIHASKPRECPRRVHIMSGHVPRLATFSSLSTYGIWMH